MAPCDGTCPKMPHTWALVPTMAKSDASPPNSVVTGVFCLKLLPCKMASSADGPVLATRR